MRCGCLVKNSNKDSAAFWRGGNAFPIFFYMRLNFVYWVEDGQIKILGDTGDWCKANFSRILSWLLANTHGRPSQWPRGIRRGYAVARLLRLCVRISSGAWMSVVSFVCWQVEVSATCWSLVQRSPTDCGASFCVIYEPREWGGPGSLGAVAPKTKYSWSIPPPTPPNVTRQVTPTFRRLISFCSFVKTNRLL